LRLALPEREAQSIRQGQAVDVTLDGPATAPSARGIVARVAPSIDADSRSLLIEADIPNPGNLRPGHFVRARIRTGARSALTIPETALVTFAGLQKVILVQAGKAIEQTVTTGTLQAGRIEITSGLNPGDQIVRTPGNLQQGQPVRIHGGQ
jgi:HlyD family secretion protein